MPDTNKASTIIDWRTNPEEWIRERIEQKKIADGKASLGFRMEDDTSKLYRAVKELCAAYVDGCESIPEADLLSLLGWIRPCIGSYKYRIDTHWVSFDRFAFPASMVGFSALKKMKASADTVALGPIRPSPGYDTVDMESALGTLIRAIDVSASSSAVVRKAHNKTRVTGRPEDQGIRVSIDLDPAIETLPRGKTLPKSPLTAALVGREVDGNEVESMRESAGLCMEGTTQFLCKHGIDHYTDGGDYECESCGNTQESDDDQTIGHCESFELTQDMVDDLDAQGHLDGVLSHFGFEENTSESWEALLGSDSEADLLESLLPTPDEVGPEAVSLGVKYNPDAWSFAVDFEEIDGLEELDFAQLAILLPMLQRVTAEYEKQGKLPPFAGCLKRKEDTTDQNMRTSILCREGKDSWSWDPSTGKLSHVSGGTDGARIMFDVQTGAIRIQRADSNTWGASAHVERKEDDTYTPARVSYVIRTDATDAGSAFGNYVTLAQGKMEI